MDALQLGNDVVEDLVRGISDIHIHTRRIGTRDVAQPDSSLIFPWPAVVSNPRRAGQAYRHLLQDMLVKCLEVGVASFTIRAGDNVFRGQRDSEAVDGLWFKMRKMPKVAPTLDTLPSRLPAPIRAQLLSPRLRRGGLILVLGAMGVGKTHTASATLTSRLMEFGGLAHTVEQPPEMPLNGFHGEGYCSQHWVRNEGPEAWAEAMRTALRSQAANTPSMLYVGEIRDAETAVLMLRAASNGFLVIATAFGSDIISGLQTYHELIGGKKSQSANLAEVLRIVLFQNLEKGRFSVSALVSDGPTSTVGNIIRPGNFVSLRDEIIRQKQEVIKQMSSGKTQPVTV